MLSGFFLQRLVLLGNEHDFNVLEVVKGPLER